MHSNWRWREFLPILFLVVVLTVLWRVPVTSWLVYPFRLFGTFIHELSHGAMALASGGEFQRFAVHADLSGLAWSSGGVRWLVLSAGYVGSALWGGVLLSLAARGVPPRLLLYGMSAVLLGMSLLLIANLFGLLSAALLASALFYAARNLSDAAALWLLRLLAVMLLFDSLGSLLDLVWISTHGDAMTDAHLMAQSTGISAVVWSVAWCVISLCLTGASFFVAFRRTTDA